MSCIYLVRHGHPETEDDCTRCIGPGSDLPLSGSGRKQAMALARCFDGLDFGRIYSSTLRRSFETAELLSDGRWSTCALSGIDEIGVGEWEGLSFEEIRTRYPEVYEARGKDWAISPPGGESLENAADRVEQTIRGLAGTENRDILAVTHDGCIRALLWRLLALDTKEGAIIRQPYGSITVLKYDNGQLAAAAMGRMPEDFPGDEEIGELWNTCETPDDVRAHCLAVCEEVNRISARLADTGSPLSREQLRAAALLHDLCRQAGKEHAVHAARIIRERGYLKVARMVEQHHGGGFKGGIDEAQVLYLADKRIDGSRKVTIQERFDASRIKCTTEEAMQRHEFRYREALQIEDRINRRLGGRT